MKDGKNKLENEGSDFSKGKGRRVTSERQRSSVIVAAPVENRQK